MPDMITVRRVIQPGDCDILGHMNMARYFDLTSEAGFTLQAAMGLDRADMAEGRRMSFVPARAQSAYYFELLAGDCVYVRSCLITASRKTATFQHRVYRTGDEKLCFESSFRSILMHLEKRRAVSIPDDVQDAMKHYLIEEKGD